jgi:hypothetical protein
MATRRVRLKIQRIRRVRGTKMRQKLPQGAEHVGPLSAAGAQAAAARPARTAPIAALVEPRIRAPAIRSPEI